MERVLVPLLAIAVGIALLFFRDAMAKAVVRGQNDWGFRFGARAERQSVAAAITMGLILISGGVAALLGVPLGRLAEAWLPAPRGTDSATPRIIALVVFVGFFLSAVVWLVHLARTPRRTPIDRRRWLALYMAVVALGGIAVVISQLT